MPATVSITVPITTQFSYQTHGEGIINILLLPWMKKRSSNSPKVTQIARGRPDVGTETLQSDFRSILTITLPCLFRLVLYLAQIHKQTEHNVLLCMLWKKFETDGYCHTACWLKKRSETKRQYGVVIESVGSAFKQFGFEFQLC